MTTSLCKLDIDFFNAFKDFLNDIVIIDESENITFYQYLLEKTDVTKHENAVKKHIETIDSYFESHLDNIKDDKFIGSIEYSNTIFVNIENMYNLVNKENQKQLKLHLLKLAVLYEKRHKIQNDHFKNMAMEIQKNIDSSGNNSGLNNSKLNIDKLLSPELLGNILNKVSSNESLSKINETDINDPAKLINNIMQSGIVNDIIDMVSNQN